MNQQFIDHLIELRNHYRLQQLENEHRRQHVAQQLTHVDALLVDQLKSSNLVEMLVKLRHQYQQQIAECNSQVAHCGEQLFHINALLADQIVQQHEHPTLRATVDRQSLKEAPKLTDDELPEEGRLETELDDLVSPSEEIHDRTANSFQPAATEQLVTDSEQIEPATNFSSSEIEAESGLEELSSPETTESSVGKTEILEESSSDEQPLEIPLLPQYQHLTKPEALSQLMKEKAGSALHIDWLLRELYGELDEVQTAAERERLSETLRDGFEQGLWEKAPGAPECFMVDLGLVDPDLAKKTTQKQQDQTKSASTTKPSLTVLPKYSGLKLIDAVELIVSDKAGKLLTTDLVVKALCGDVSDRELTQAKEIVGRTLRRGAEAKRWHRVPRQKGIYTLDMGIIEPAPGSDNIPSRVKKAGQESLTILPAYSRMSFTDAIATVLREHQGAVMTPEQVARALFGDDLSGTRLSKARKKVSRVLWGGASKKKWRRLTGVIGRYTLDRIN